MKVDLTIEEIYTILPQLNCTPVNDYDNLMLENIKAKLNKVIGETITHIPESE